MDDELSNEGVSHHIKDQIDLGLKRVFEEIAQDEISHELQELIERLKTQQIIDSGDTER